MLGGMDAAGTVGLWPVQRRSHHSKRVLPCCFGSSIADQVTDRQCCAMDAVQECVYGALFARAVCGAALLGCGRFTAQRCRGEGCVGGYAAKANMASSAAQRCGRGLRKFSLAGAVAEAAAEARAQHAGS